MSKAFTKEEDAVAPPPVSRRGVQVPQGVPNYVTAAGMRAMRAELEALPGDATERAHELSEHLATAVAIEAPADPARVGFGATVTVADERGSRTRYRIVGAIEASPRDGAIYWQSPIALALHDAAVGDTVTLPRGEVEVVAIEYGMLTASGW